MKEWQGEPAVVTGGASGIGLAIARSLARAGMSVVLADIRQDALEMAVDGLRQEGLSAAAMVLDVSDPQSVSRAAQSVVRLHGVPRVLVNNAGVAFHGTPLEEVSSADWQWVLGVNLMGVIHGVQSFLPLMKARGGSAHIVNTASGSGFFVRSGRHQGPYAVSKYAVVAYSEALEQELQGTAIGVSVLCPGAVESHLHESGGRRPRRYGEAAVRPEEAFLKDLTAKGLPADAVGEQVVSAIRNGQFYIFTHLALKPLIEQRHARILAAFDGVPA